MATQSISRFFQERFGAWRAPRIVDEHLGVLLERLEQNQVVVLTAGTSAGKTSRVPQALQLAYPKSHIWLSQPRRKAVRKNGGWIAQEMGCQPGNLVGWRLVGSDGENRESQATRIHLRVDQSLVNQIIRDGELPKGFIIVDEAHERSIAIDLLLGLLKERLPESPNTRVVITSATIDARKFSEFFDGAPVIEVPGTGHPIHTEVIRLGRGEHHTQAAGHGACMALDKFLEGEPLVPSLEGDRLVPVSKGTVLVLLPGKEDIRDVMRIIRWHAKSRGAEDRIEIFECHSETESAADDLIDRPLDDGKLRFVCATEVVRTSVTISEVIGVIDSLQVKRPIANAIGVVHLDKITISRAEAEQGKGRGGRERPAFYWPVSFGREHENLEPHPRPAVLYSPIESVALSIAAIGKSIRTFPLVDRPADERIEVAMKRLQRLGLMDTHEAITEFGREVERLSVDVASAVSFAAAEKLGVLSEAIIASAIRENEGIFWLPPREDDLLADEDLLRLVLNHCRKRDAYSHRWEACQPEKASGYDPANLPEWIQKDEAGRLLIKCKHPYFPWNEEGESGARWVASLVRKHWAGPERSDFAASVRAYRSYKARGRLAGQFLNHRKIGFVDHTISLLQEELAGSTFRLNGGLYAEREFDGNALTKALATGLIDNVLVKDGYYRGPLGDSVEISRGSACPTEATAVLVGGVRKVEVPDRRGRTMLRYFAEMAAPVNPSWLVEIMPQLCELKRRGDHAYDRGTDCVRETQEIKFVDLTLERKVKSEDLEGIARALGVTVHQDLYREFQDVTDHTRRVMDDARGFYCRSGGKSRMITQEDEIVHYATVFFLNGICSYADWQRAVAEGRVSSDDLLLSLETFVSKAEQKRILLENPATIEVAGQELPVQYADGYNHPVTPQVTLPKEMLSSHAWLDLPDEGIHLPGGRVVKVSAGYDSGTDIPALKGKIKESLNAGQWYAWADRQKRDAQDLADEHTAIPEITTAQYGTCVVTGEPLFAYGAIKMDTYYGYGRFSTEWFRTKEEAEKVRAAAVQKLEEIRAEAQQKQEREQAKAEAEAARSELDQVMHRADWYDIPLAIRDRAGMRRYAYLPNSLEELRKWIAETKAITAEAKSAFAEVAAQKARVVRAKERMVALLEAEYKKCPICELLLVDEHICAEWLQPSLYTMMRGEDSRTVKVSRVGGEVIASLTVLVNRYREVAFSLWTDRTALVQSPDAEIETEVLWVPSIKTRQPEQPQKASAVASHFEVTQKDRHFRHNCGANTRVTNTEWARYLAGKSITVRCGVCKAVDTVKK